jgi:hypothetical protein
MTDPAMTGPAGLDPAALAPLRDLLQPDGADIELVGFADGTLRLRLCLEGAECGDGCVLPRALLESLALQLIQPLVPGLGAVRIDDPREA